LTGGWVNRGGLDGRDFVLAQALAHDIKPAGERGITECPVRFAWERRSNGGDQGFFGVAELALRLCKRRGNRTDRFTGSVHRRSPDPEGQS
jgi:hypothetical protein